MTTVVPSTTSVDVAATDTNATTDDASMWVIVENKGSGDSDNVDEWMMNG